MNPLLLTDFYKVHHNKMYPEGMSLLYSNFTPRKSRIPGVDKVVVFGIQHFIKKYLFQKFHEDFFNRPLAEVIEEYKFAIDVDTDHIKALHKLGYLPIEIKALPEGTLCPIGVPLMTIKNTHPDFAWFTNYLETLISCQLWQPITSATIAYEYKKLLTKYAIETTGSDEFVQWQGHDFSMRGMSSVESAILSGMGHLLSFTGTDTIPAIYSLRSSYYADGLIGASVPATEHSVMCMGQKESEINTFKRLLNLYPTGILSVVSDTWDLWKVLTEYLPTIKNEVLSRDGKLVIRPDSGDPVDILCGKYPYPEVEDRTVLHPEQKGVIELLWDIFGGTVNEKGYKILNSHIGAIYGDSITTQRAEEICKRLKAKGFASTNVVFGIGSYTYQYNTRDTFGFAMKATYGEVKDIDTSGMTEVLDCREIFKDPITDDGTKKSKKGLLHVYNDGDKIVVQDQVDKTIERRGLLETVFIDGAAIRTHTLEEIRNRLKSQK
jgi:nicotinamide phosphoribosyltransferase